MLNKLVIVGLGVVFVILVVSLSVGLRPKNDGSNNLRDGATAKILGGAAVDSTSQYGFFTFLQGNAACAGSLVAPDMVLTAAQCLGVLEIGDSIIVNAYSRGPSDVHVVRTAVEMVAHPSYEFPYYDFALIRLDEPVPDVEPVTINTESDFPAVGNDVTVVGLGNLSEEGGVPEVLQQVGVNVVANPICQESYSAPIIDGIMICAGVAQGGRDACNGDAGGPLLVDGVQVGIVSAGNGCGRPGFPGIYARVSWAADWIVSTICEVSLADPDFCSAEETVSPTTNDADLPIGTSSPAPTDVMATDSPAPETESPIMTDAPEEFPGQGPPDEVPGQGPPDEVPGQGPPEEVPGQGPPEGNPGQGNQP